MLSKIGPTKRTQSEDHFLDPKQGPENERPDSHWTKSPDQNREPKVAPILGLKNDFFFATRINLHLGSLRCQVSVAQLQQEFLQGVVLPTMVV